MTYLLFCWVIVSVVLGYSQGIAMANKHVPQWLIELQLKYPMPKEKADFARAVFWLMGYLVFTLSTMLIFFILNGLIFIPLCILYGVTQWLCFS